MSKFDLPEQLEAPYFMPLVQKSRGESLESDFEFAKPEDNTPDKLVMRAIIEAQNDNNKVSAIKMHPDFYHKFYDQYKDQISFTCDTAQKSTFWGFAVEVDELVKKDFELTIE